MTKFEFNKSWIPKLELKVLTRLGDEAMFSPKAYQQWIRDLYHDHKSNKVQFRIEAARNNNDIPEISQIKAIEFILNNEEEIYKNIYQNLIDVVYPYYSELFEEDIQEYAPLNDIEKLPKVLGLIQITVNIMNRNQIAWTTYMFEWKGEEEHGLSMLFEGSKFLKHSGAGDMWFDEIVKEEELEVLRKEWNLQMPKKLYYPNDSLKSYKPWQLEKTKDYLIDLLNEDKLSEFKKIVSRNDFDVNIRIPEDGYPLIEEIVRKGFLDAGKYLFEKGANIEGLMHWGNPYYENTSRIEFINIVNGDINETNEEGLSLIEKYLTIAKREFGFNNMKSMGLYEKHIKLLLKYEAKITNMEKYKEVLKHMNLWNKGGWFNKLFE